MNEAVSELTARRTRPLPAVAWAALWSLFQVLLAPTAVAEAPVTNTPAPLFTVHIQTQPSPPLTLVAHSEVWRYRKGTNAPPPNWQTTPDERLDPSWASGPGGFGYGDNDDATVLDDMRNRYSSVYIRKTFNVPPGIDPERRLHLLMDWDDGFVAYLDGNEVARALAPGPPGTEPSFRATALNSHEASRGDNIPNAPRVFDLGAIGAWLTPGLHTLAIHGLNQETNSTDFSLIADLLVDGADTRVVDGALLGVVKTNVVTLFGTNTLPNAARLLVNGTSVSLDPAGGRWSKVHSLTGGVNHVRVEALDGAGNRLAATNKLVISELLTTHVGGVSATNTVWSGDHGVIRVTNHLVIPVRGELSIRSGAIVLFSPNVSIVGTNATLKIQGAENEKVILAPADGTSPWGPLLISGAQGIFQLQHAEVIAGNIEVRDGATGLLEDSYLHDFVSAPIIYALSAASFVERRCHVARYYEHLIALTPALIEDCLCEFIYGDGIDFDGAPAGSTIRRCTIRHGDGANIDGIDLGNYPGVSTSGVSIEQCLIYDFPFDKGISIGESSRDIVIRNCLIYGVDSGIAIKDSSQATISNTTIVQSNVGLNLCEKNLRQGGGHALSFNNILWSLKTSIVSTNDSTITVDHTLLAAPNGWPGTNNLALDPMFRNAALRDYHLSPKSPALSAGRGGANLGALLPPGSALVDDDRDEMPDVWELWHGLNPLDSADALSDSDSDGLLNGQEYAAGTEPLDSTSSLKLRWARRGNRIDLQFTAVSGKSYSVLRRDSLGAGPWIELRKIDSSAEARLIEVEDSAAPGEAAQFYRVVTPAWR